MERFVPLALCCIATAGAFNLTLLHVNDLHSRFAQVNGRGADCVKSQNNAKCFGGVARMKAAVSSFKQQNPNTVFLNAGDFFQGTVWYSLYKWRVVANLTSGIGLDATSPGNHEFDDGVNDLALFLSATGRAFPMIACNIDLSSEPQLSGRIPPSITLDMGGTRVGVIGYVTPETTQLVQSVGRVKILPEIESIQREAKKLKSQGVKVIIALGHSGFSMDKIIAKEVADLDVVVGGHTNTFLYSGQTSPRQPCGRDKVDEYPTVVQNDAGQKVLVVQTCGWGFYLGKLDIAFNDDGEIESFSGNPVLLDESFPEDPDLKAVVDAYKAEVESRSSQVIGKAPLDLEFSKRLCRLFECSCGDLVTDAMASEMGVDIAMINGGSIKGRMEKGTITVGDVMRVMPWANTIDVVGLPGRTIKAALEHSASEYFFDIKDPKGRFMQVSGLIVYYDMSQPDGAKLQSVWKGMPDHCEDWEEILDEKTYEVATLSFLVKGGDGFTMIRDDKTFHKNTGYLDFDLIKEYIRKHDPLEAPASRRIRFGTDGDLACVDPSVASPVTSGSSWMASGSSWMIPVRVIICFGFVVHEFLSL